MAGFEQNDMGGALFRHDKKGNERAPDYKGDCKISGQTLQISGWVKEGRKGKYLSLKFDTRQPPQQLPHTDIPVDAAGFQPKPPAESAVDDIPF